MSHFIWELFSVYQTIPVNQLKRGLARLYSSGEGMASMFTRQPSHLAEESQRRVCDTPNSRNKDQGVSLWDASPSWWCYCSCVQLLVRWERLCTWVLSEGVCHLEQVKTAVLVSVLLQMGTECEMGMSEFELFWQPYSIHMVHMVCMVLKKRKASMIVILELWSLLNWHTDL